MPVSAAELLTGGGAEAEAGDTHRLVRGSIGSYTDRSSGRRLQAAVFRLEGRLADGSQWTTSLRVAVPPHAEQTALFAEPDEPATRTAMAATPMGVAGPGAPPPSGDRIRAARQSATDP
ncbi:hypothetical protein GCM10022225_30590 [Plantactinospora mayteni]|uniref:Uncharacterized protein n=1 Tax=Plantactinospora mayteni TaxID=566021 RepID=A0ABQ4EVL9_9ACTN|nr:hypothetical protein Pma05_52680 [Plantactinospora mayteni]